MDERLLSHEFKNHQQKKTIDEVIESIPVSWFHYKILLLCGVAFMTDAMEVSLLSYLSTCAGDEWNLSTNDRATITSLVFGGEIVGTLFWGRFADEYGRRKSYLIGCFLISAGGILSGLSPSYGWLLFFRFIVGFGVGGSTVPFDLLAELIPLGQRGKYLMFVAVFFTFGSLFVNSLAWGLLDSSGWRTLTYLTALPVTIASLTSCYFLPESPRWLLVKGRIEEAEQVLRNAAKQCNHDLGEFQLRSDIIHSEHETRDAACIELFNNASVRKISIPLVIVWLCFGIAYYGIILFVAKVYSTTTTTYDNNANTCSFDYQSIFINSTAEIVGVILGLVIIDYGRTISQAVTYLMCGLMLFPIGFNISSNSVISLAWFARLFAMTSSSITWVATPELFPTEIRATGHSLCSTAARFGAFISPYFVFSSLSPLAVAFGLSSVNICAAVASYMLPETVGTILDVVVRTSSMISDGNFDRKSISNLIESFN